MLTAFLSVISFAIGTIFYNFWVGLGGFFLGFLISVLVSVQLLKTPFSEMLEGKGILVFDNPSTGIITPFIVRVEGAYVKGKIKNKNIVDVFDRNAVHMMNAPVKNNDSVAVPISDEDDEKKGGISIKLGQNDYNSARFAMFQFPVLFYNSLIGSFVTKDFLSDEEKKVFANHQVLYLNRRVEELTTDIKNFARHVVDLLKPGTSILQSKLFWIILLIGLVILAVLFAPTILKTLQGSMAPAMDAVAGATEGISNNAINPVK